MTPPTSDGEEVPAPGGVPTPAEVDPLADEAADAEANDDSTACAYTEYREAEGDSGSKAERDLPATGADATGVQARVWEAVREVEDPEMPVSVVNLGLIYGVTVEDGEATVEMTLTYTGCPARSMLTDEIERAAASAEGVEDARVRLVWSPEWTLEMVTDEGRAALREFGVSV